MPGSLRWRCEIVQDHIGRQIDSLTLAALNRKTVRLSCSCGHERLLDAIALWWLFERKRWPDALREVGKHFFCAECWRRHIQKRKPRVELTERAFEGQQPSYPDERTWKRLVSRYRS